MIEYPYAVADPLENRNTYFFSSYGGVSFLLAWIEHRNAFMNASGRLVPVSTDTELNFGKTGKKLTDIIKENEKEQDSNSLRDFDRILQRFEVSKRLHREYTDRWRPVDQSDYRCWELYVLFAQASLCAYRRSRKLAYLNALIKCLDTLTAGYENLSRDQVTRVRDAVRGEQMAVYELAERLGVDLA